MITLQPVRFPQDKTQYTENVLPLLKPDDAFSYEELLARMQEDILTWWVLDETGEIIGWCSAGDSPYVEGAIHLYGFCIWPTHQNQGYGTETLLARIALYPNQTITTSIQKDSVASIRLAKKLGFEFLNTVEPWDNYALPAAKHPGR